MVAIHAGQMAAPKLAVAAAASAATVIVAVAKQRQAPAAIKATGINSPTCGLNASSPKHSPANIGRAAMSRAPPTISAADNMPFWPDSNDITVAGAKARNRTASDFSRGAKAAARNAASPAADQIAQAGVIASQPSGASRKMVKGG